MTFLDWWSEQSQWNKVGMCVVAAVALILILLWIV